MAGDGDGGGRPQLTVGSLLGLPLGAMGDEATPHMPLGAPGPSAEAEGTSASQEAAAAGGLTTEERPWTIAGGRLGEPSTKAPFTSDGVEALTYDNVLRQDIEQVWFDGKVVYALDAGEVDVDPSRVKVAQEYQIVYAAELDEHGKPTSEPPRVPGQLNIYDSIPGMEQYSPLWQFNYVIVPGDY